MADNIIASFLAEIGFKVDKSSEDKLKATVRTAAVQAQLLADALEAMAKTAAQALEGVIKGFNDLYFASQRTNSSVANIRAMSYAFSQVGQSGQAAVAALDSFARATRTNPGVAAFVRSLGVATHDAKGKMRDASEVLFESVDVLRKRHPYWTGAQLAENLGITEESFFAMTKYRKELEAYGAEHKRIVAAVGLNEQEAAENSNKFSRALRSVYEVASVVGEKIASAVLPTITKWIELLREWLLENSDKFVPAIQAILKEAENFAKQGGFIDMMKTLVDTAKTLAKHFRDILDFIRQINAFVKGDAVGAAVSWLLGNQPGGANASGGVPPANENGEAEKPGLLRRGYNAVKRALGFGGGTDSSGGRKANGGGGVEGARESYNFWRSKGLTHEQAAGLVGMEEGESQFNPRAVGDGTLAHGAFQHHPDRRAAILRGTGINIDTATHLEQLEGAYWEMQHGDAGAQRAWRRIKEAKTAGEVASIGVYDFERPLDKPSQAAIRGQYANKWAERFKGSPVVGPGATPAPVALPKLPAFTGMNAGGFDPNKLGAAPMGSTSISNASTFNHAPNVNVKIEGVSDPQRAAEHVGRVVNDANQLSLRNAQTALR